MKKLVHLLLIACVVVLQTCAISFSGKQNISYVVRKPVLSNNKQSEFESISLRKYRKDDSNWFDNDAIARYIIESHR